MTATHPLRGAAVGQETPKVGPWQRYPGMLARQVTVEIKMYWRNRAAFFFGFLLPLLFLLFFGSLNRNNRVNGHQFIDFFLPGMLGFSVVATALSNLAISLPIQRDQLILKRLRATPIPTMLFLAGKVLMATIVILAQSVVMLVVGFLFFDLTIPRSLVAVALWLIAGSMVFSAIGFALAGLIPTGDAAPAIVNAVYLPMVFLGGAFFPTDSMPRFLRLVAEVLPLTYFIEEVRIAFDGSASLRTDAVALLVLAVWFVGSGLLAARTFRWVP